MLCSTAASILRCPVLGSDKSFIVGFLLHEFLELVASDTGGPVRGGDERAAGVNQDWTFLAGRNSKTLGLQFGLESLGSSGESSLQFRAIETWRNPLGAFSGDVGKTFRLGLTPLVTGRLHLLAVIGFVTTGEVFQTTEIILAVEHLERSRVHLSDRKMKMGPPILDMPH